MTKRVAEPSPWESRERRYPLYVPVATEPLLSNSWAVNLSIDGIGLMASQSPGQPMPKEGDALSVAFDLPGGAPVRARGEVRWLYGTTGSVDGQGGWALGIQFTEVASQVRTLLMSYFRAYRPQTLVLFAEAEERRWLEGLLGDRLTLHFVHDARQADEVLARGDIAVALVCGHDSERALAWAERVHASVPDRPGSAGGVADDLTPRVVYAAAANPEQLVQAFNSGWLFTIVPRPLEADALQTALMRAARDHGVRTEQHRVAFALERALDRERARKRSGHTLMEGAQEELVYRSEAMQEVMRLVRIAAPHPVSVLLQGETGTGKEVIGRLLHHASDRAGVPFVVQDCGALTETLLESELFGHVKGAFTGATASHPGLFVLANGGTIFLDELQNTTANVQAKLLRVIEAGEVRPVGSSEVRRVDVRVIAASNVGLEREVAAGRLRADLYFRLAAFPIDIPPLRQRVADIAPLAHHFLEQAGQRLKLPIPALSPAVMAALEAYGWPGNARELRNTMDRALLLSAPDTVITIEHLPKGIAAGTLSVIPLGDEAAEQGSGALEEQLKAFESKVIDAALRRNNGVVRRAALDLAVNPVTLARRARRLGLLS